MSKRVRVPKYSLHKPSVQACVQINRKMTYLGKYGSPESPIRYEQLLADLQKRDETKPEAASLSVSALCIMYVAHCREYYRKNGKETSEVGCIQQALTPHSSMKNVTTMQQKLSSGRWAEVLTVCHCHR